MERHIRPRMEPQEVSDNEIDEIAQTESIKRVTDFMPHAVVILIMIVLIISINVTKKDIIKEKKLINTLNSRINTLNDNNNITKGEIAKSYETIRDIEKLMPILKENITKKENKISSLKRDIDITNENITVNQMKGILLKKRYSFLFNESKALLGKYIKLHDHLLDIYFARSLYMLNEMNSNIIDTLPEYDMLLDFTGGKKFIQCFSSDKDLFSVNTFHVNCDKISHSLVLYQTTTYERFGGYSTLPWDGSKGNTDDNAFIFNVDTKVKFPINTRGNNISTVIQDKRWYPSFGLNADKCDICVYEPNDSLIDKEKSKNENIDIYAFGITNFPNGYGDAKNKNDKVYFLSKYNEFDINAIEVYEVIFDR